MTAVVLTVMLLLLLLTSSSIALFGRRLGERSHQIGIPAIAFAFVGAVLILLSVTSGGPVQFEMPMFSSAVPDWFRIDFYVDRLSAVLLLLITGISSVIHVYSIRYMQGDRDYSRFFSLLGFMTFVLLALVTSGSLFMLLVWWQLVSFLLYLLLCHNYGHGPAVRSAFKSFVILRLGDIALLMGVLLAYKTYGTLQFPALFERALSNTHIIQLWSAGPEISTATAVTLLLFIGAMSKSAQLPLHIWLPDTMDAPTPVSALMHAGIVNAGGFLINRLAPLYGQSSATLHVVFLVGLLTTIVGTTIMLTRTDVKTKLGFSTMGQMGFMIMECGLGAFALAIFHLIAHGIFKATLFLSAGTVIGKVRKEPHLSPREKPSEPKAFRSLPWATGVLMTLLMPLVILLVAHTVVAVPLQDDQGTIILLFFAWVTSSQAILSLYSLRMIGSGKVTIAMVLAVFLIVVTYVWATDTFTYFLYPTPGEAARYFDAAAFPLWLFDSFIGVILLLLLCGWSVNYTNRRGEHTLSPHWLRSLTPGSYVCFWNRFHLDRLYLMLGQNIVDSAKRLDATLPDWIP